MAGEAYPKRWPAGFVDNDTSKYADAQFLNNAEAALLRLLGADPIDQGVQVWDAGLGRMKSIKLTNSQIDPSAAIDKSKLAALNIVDADISGAAGIAKSKLNLNGAIANADIASGAAIVGSKLATGLTGPPSSQVDYVEVASSQTSTATTAAGAVAVVTANAVTFDGSTPVWIEFQCTNVSHSAGSATIILFELYDGATDLGVIARYTSTSGSYTQTVLGRRKLTPSAAAHTYSVRMWASVAGTATAAATAGGAGSDLPIFLRIVRA